MNAVRIPDPSEKQFDPLPVIPGGEYRARLEKVEERPNNFNPESPQYLWFWRLVQPGGEYDNNLVFQYTSQKFGEYTDKDTNTVKKAQARKNLESLMGAPLAANAEFDWEAQIFGLEAILSVIRKAKGDGTIINKVVDVLPLSLGGLGVVTKEAQPPQAAQKPTQAREELGYIRRFEQAKATLQWEPETIVETIVAITGARKPFQMLKPDEQAKVLELMEQAANDVDIPF